VACGPNSVFVIGRSQEIVNLNAEEVESKIILKGLKSNLLKDSTLAHFFFSK
jgi:hypothetical protein